MSKKVDLNGQVFDRLTVIREHDKRAKNKNIMWECKCFCGKYVIVSSSHLITGHTKSCGCLHKDNHTKHSCHNLKKYHVWNGMMTRCYNPNSKNYLNYGGRGITVCDRWRESPANFIADMGECLDGYSIERIDVNGNYEPSNCKWANQLEQARNKRTNNFIEFNGVSLCISGWCERLGIKRSTLNNRLTVMGWSIEKSLTTPVRAKLKNKAA